jgi:hypothetical protein
VKRNMLWSTSLFSTTTMMTPPSTVLNVISWYVDADARAQMRREHARTISQLAQVPTKASSVRVVRTQIVHTSIEDHDIEISSQPRALKVPD